MNSYLKENVLNYIEFIHPDNPKYPMQKKDDPYKYPLDNDSLLRAMGAFSSGHAEESSFDWEEEEAEWQEPQQSCVNPWGLKCASDTYYQKLTRRLREVMERLTLPPTLTEGGQERIAQSCSVYLMDVVSGLGVWKAVREAMQMRYGRKLPFYDAEADADYFDDEVNEQDVCFLVWNALSSLYRTRGDWFYPLDPWILALGRELYKVLHEEYEKAPEASRLLQRIDATLRKGNFYECRPLARWLAMDVPYTSVPGFFEWVYERASDWAEHTGLPMDKMLYAAEADEIWTQELYPLGIRPQDLLARMARDHGHEATAENLSGLKVRHLAPYAIESTDKEWFHLKCVATGEQIKVEASSLGERSRIRKVAGLKSSLVWYGDRWLFNGVAAPMTSRQLADLEKDLKKSKEKFAKETPEALMDWENDPHPEIVAELLEKNHGRRMGFFRDMLAFMDFMGEMIPDTVRKAVEEEIAAAPATSGDDPATSFHCNFTIYLPDDSSGHWDVGEEIAQYFKASYNPLYDEDQARDDGFYEVIFAQRIAAPALHFAACEGMFADFCFPASEPGTWSGNEAAATQLLASNLHFFIDYYSTSNPYYA